MAPTKHELNHSYKEAAEELKSQLLGAREQYVDNRLELKSPYTKPDSKMIEEITPVKEEHVTNIEKALGELRSKESELSRSISRNLHEIAQLSKYFKEPPPAAAPATSLSSTDFLENALAQLRIILDRPQIPPIQVDEASLSASLVKLAARYDELELKCTKLDEDLHTTKEELAAEKRKRDEIKQQHHNLVRSVIDANPSTTVADQALIEMGVDETWKLLGPLFDARVKEGEKEWELFQQELRRK